MPSLDQQLIDVFGKEIHVNVAANEIKIYELVSRNISQYCRNDIEDAD